MEQITQEELLQLQNIQQTQQQITTQLGQVQIQKQQLKLKKQQLLELLTQLEQESQTLSQFLESKYGQCSIDINTGQVTVI